MSPESAATRSTDKIVHLNVGGTKFSSSLSTLTWVPDSFFTSLLSGRISSLKDEETGAIFIDRDPDAFRVILNWLRTKQVDLSRVPIALLKHEAMFYGLGPLVKRLSLCDELEESACGNVLYTAMIPAPRLNFDSQTAKNKATASQSSSSSSVPFSPKVHGHMKKGSGEMLRFDANRPMLRVRQIKAHHNMIAVAYSEYVCVYRLRESAGWNPIFTTPRVDAEIQLVAMHTKFGPQGSDKMLAVSLANGTILLWSMDDDNGTKKGSFVCDCPISRLFFVGSQLVALSRKGKVIIWHSVSQNWQVQDVMPISCYDTAGSSLILGCVNGEKYYIDMQKFPLRMKDNDLLVTELYKDPNGECITALSVYLTPKTNVCGNWIEIAYGTASGTVRLIVQHPETVGHGPQLFQTFTVHNSSIMTVALTTNYLISVCSEYNHVRTWAITRFRGMISTQPGSTSLASFKVLTLDVVGENHEREPICPGWK
ncbi:hypothetical protein WR25_26563 [Diploscapter pachys]|uniref:BTB domain-containing protein n=1 Tax=Diploscapter pachys TaxID=2018661 RepID=A0A2A2LSL4_9BILA|nr:hypothetical protein WR25_26563 [Diploscapter pachys]